MKKFIGATLALTLIFAQISVSAQISDTSSEQKIYSISLNDAVNMAYEENAQIEANLLKQKGNKLNLSVARISKREAKNVKANISSGFELYCVKNGYYVKASEMALRISEMESEKIKANIAYNVTQSYYNLVLMQKLLDAAENSYELALNNKKAVDAQFELGLIPEIDYQNAEVTVQLCENALNEYKLNYEIAEQNLKILINKDEENCKIIPTDEIECEEYTSNPEEDIKNALETRFDLSSLKENRNLCEEYFNCAKAGGDGSAIYNTAYASFMEADYNYINTRKLIALSIKSQYNTIITSNAKMETARTQYEIDLKEYEAAKLKYELGMIANLELTKSINDLYNSQVNYANAKLNYRLAVEKYKHEITIGL